MVVLAGVHAVKHALRFGATVETLVSADPAAALAVLAAVAPDVLPAVRAAVRQVPAAEVARIAGGPVELVGLARRPVSVPAGGGPTVLLDNPRQLGNLGAVVRVAAGYGARAVLSTGTVDPWHPTVVRAAAGLHFAVEVRRVEPADVPGPLLAFDPAGEDVRSVRIPDDAVLAFGSERHGLSEPIRSRATRLLAIPIRPGVSSYNLATSVAAALYAWTAGAGSAGRDIA